MSSTVSRTPSLNNPPQISNVKARDFFKVKLSLVTSIIGSIAGVVIVGLSAANMFGSPGSAEFIGSLNGGVLLTTVASGFTIYLLVLYSRYAKKEALAKKRQAVRDSFQAFGKNSSKETNAPTGHSATVNSENSSKATTGASSTAPKNPFSEYGQVIYIGSDESRLNEQGIREKLKTFQGKKDVDALVIYGDGKVRFNRDPGFVDMNPKKLILVGARIIHAPCSGIRLDDELVKKGWRFSSVRVVPMNGVNPNDATFIEQLSMPSLSIALSHKPKKRGPTVYLIKS